MTTDGDWIEHGGVTSPAGFTAGATYAGIKTYGSEPRFDLGLVLSDRDCAAAGVFTQNLVCGAPVELCREHLRAGAGRAIVVNSGCSNVAMGERGRRDARRMAELAAEKLRIAPASVFVASTGVIGRPLPMEAIEKKIVEIELTKEGGGAFSRAIMTTDRVPKSRALRFESAGRVYSIGGCAKGAGMVHPDMATMLCFLTTDAPVEPRFLQATLRAVADVSFNMIDVDMDTSTSDTMLLFANGAAGGDRIDESHRTAAVFKDALKKLAIELARDLVRDAEGAKTLIEVVVEGARTLEDARKAARTVSASPLVKSMVAGRDANLGRVLMAIGRSGAHVDVGRTSVFIGGECAFRDGVPTDVDYAVLAKSMDAKEVRFVVNLGLGSESATAWGCDLTEEYVRINANYTT